VRIAGVGQPAGGVAVPGLGAGDPYAIADDDDGLAGTGVDAATVDVAFGGVGLPAVDPQAATNVATVASRARKTNERGMAEPPSWVSGDQRSRGAVVRT
jgi:hypothetical protein